MRERVSEFVLVIVSVQVRVYLVRYTSFLASECQIKCVYQ